MLTILFIQEMYPVKIVALLWRNLSLSPLKLTELTFTRLVAAFLSSRLVGSVFQRFDLQFFCVSVQIARNWIKTMRGDPLVDVFERKVQLISEGERYVPVSITFTRWLWNQNIFQTKGSQRNRSSWRLKSHLRSQTQQGRSHSLHREAIQSKLLQERHCLVCMSPQESQRFCGKDSWLISGIPRATSRTKEWPVLEFGVNGPTVGWNCPVSRPFV
jgi:hypothetical protein